MPQQRRTIWLIIFLLPTLCTNSASPQDSPSNDDLLQAIPAETHLAISVSLAQLSELLPSASFLWDPDSLLYEGLEQTLAARHGVQLENPTALGFYLLGETDWAFYVAADIHGESNRAPDEIYRETALYAAGDSVRGQSLLLTFSPELFVIGSLGGVTAPLDTTRGATVSLAEVLEDDSAAFDRSGAVVYISGPVLDAFLMGTSVTVEEHAEAAALSLSPSESHFLIRFDGPAPAEATLALLERGRGRLTATLSELLAEVAPDDELFPRLAWYTWFRVIEHVLTTRSQARVEGRDVVVDSTGIPLVNLVGPLASLALIGLEYARSE